MGRWGVVIFEGRVRNHNEGQEVLSLEYEAYPELAQKEASRIIKEAKSKFGIDSIICFHRVGRLSLGDLAVWLSVDSPHRKEAFLACQYVIDELKARVPIWKKEHYVNGEAHWVQCHGCAARL